MKLQVYAVMLIASFAVTTPGYAQTENGGTSIEKVKKETQDLLHTIDSYTADKKDKAVEKINQSLTALDERIDALEARIDNNWDQMNEAARKEARENLRAMRNQRKQVAEWYGRMKASSTDAWGHIKKGFSDAYKDLENAWKKSEQEYSAKE